MSRMDRFATAVAMGTLLLEVAVGSLLFFTGTSAHAATAQTAQTTAPRLFDALDINKDQALSRQEFQSGYVGLQRLIATQARLREQFGTLDADRSGAIDASEYENLELIRSQGKSAPALIAFDVDHDQKLNFVEYTTLVRKLSAKQISVRK